MKKIILLLVLAVCMFLSGYAYAKKNINVSSQPDQKEKYSDISSNEKEQAASKDSEVNSNSQDTKTVTISKKGEPNQSSAAKTTYTGSSVKVDISEQKVYVYDGNELIKTMVCSTGIENQDYMTPRGNFIINENGAKKGEWFYSNKYKEGAKYWVGFIGGTYLFHSVPMDINKTIIEEEADKLGTPASHGCIRLSLDDAYWFYKNIKSGTKLVIQD